MLAYTGFPSDGEYLFGITNGTGEQVKYNLRTGTVTPLCDHVSCVGETCPFRDGLGGLAAFFAGLLCAVTVFAVVFT